MPSSATATATPKSDSDKDVSPTAGHAKSSRSPLIQPKSNTKRSSTPSGTCTIPLRSIARDRTLASNTVLPFSLTRQTQEAIAKKAKADLEAGKRYSKPIATEITPAGKFYPAEEYHQRYLEKRGMASCHI